MKYTMKKLLGRGGMGAVYLADRDQAGVRQPAALKVLNQAFTNTDIARRFRQERQILASLQHPNIARLYDGGRMSDGRPFLVMEYVDGRTLTDHCDAERLPIRRRIELFLKVSDALAHAHQRLIVHRDIKPSNVLITRDGIPKLLDFGIAKPLETLAESEDLMQTATNMRLMTPNYASPEQIEGKPITTATDVYGAGVLLYELLTGHSPYARPGEIRFNGRGIELLSTIIGKDVTPPSGILVRKRPKSKNGDDAETTRRERDRRLLTIARKRGEASARSLSRKLRGDLDNIMAKALSRNPEARYASMEAMGADLRRYLSGEPVTARPTGLGYRAAKFVLRNPWPVAAAAGVLLFSLILAGAMT